MKTKFFAVLIVFFVVTSVFSQANLNDFKYVIVQNRFNFLKEADQYQLNSLTKFLFNRYGFLAFIKGDTYPKDLMENRCLALKSDVLKNPGLFKTKLKIELKDCNDRVIYTSRIGESREKEYEKAYNAALRDAFKSFETFKYTYSPKEITNIVPIPALETKPDVAKEIQLLKEEIQSLKKGKETEVIEAIGTIPMHETNKKGAIKKIEPINMVFKTVPKGVLYAQEIENGFQLVDSSPKVVYRIKRTGLDHVFLIENKNAIIYKNGNHWVMEYYENYNLKQEKLNIKF